MPIHDLNRQHPLCKSGAQPTELIRPTVPLVVLSRFSPGSFWLGRFGLGRFGQFWGWVVSALGSFGPIQYGRVYKNGFIRWTEVFLGSK